MALSPALRNLVSTQKNKYKNSGGRTVKPKEGRNTYRIIAPTPEQAPWVPATGQFWVDLGVHWIKADENGKPLAVVGDCETVHGQVSTINTAIEMALDGATDEVEKKLYSSWRARKSVIVNVIDRSANDEVVQLELTTTTWAKYLDLLELHIEHGQDITDMTTGMDIVISKSGKGLQTEYEVMMAPGVAKPVTKEQLDKAVDLPNFVNENYFRGEEQKALNAIQQISGVAVPALGASGVSTPTAALTSSAASVDQSALNEVAQAQAAQAQAAQEQAAQPQQEQATTTGLSASEEDALLADLDNLVG